MDDGSRNLGLEDGPTVLWVFRVSFDQVANSSELRVKEFVEEHN
jgi:hypothetical protein